LVVEKQIMTIDYASIKGQYVQSSASQPGTAGQIWYDSSNNNFNLTSLAAAGWITANNRTGAGFREASFGTQTAAIAAVGFPSAGSNQPAKTTTQSYDGTDWTTVNPVNTARIDAAGAGTQTAGMIAGGNLYTFPGAVNQPMTGATEEWDGTNWTSSPGSLNTARGGIGIGATGTQTAGLVFSGITSGGASDPGNTNATEEYDGSVWTTIPAGTVNTTASMMGRGGTQTAAVKVGGLVSGPANTDSVEHYDGSTWTTATAVPTSMRWANTAGPQTNLILMGYDVSGPGSTDTFKYDGSAWTAASTLPTAMARSAVGGDGDAGVVSGGFNGAEVSLTFEYNNVPVINSKTITTS